MSKRTTAEVLEMMMTTIMSDADIAKLALRVDIAPTALKRMMTPGRKADWTNTTARKCRPILKIIVRQRELREEAARSRALDPRLLTTRRNFQKALQVCGERYQTEARRFHWTGYSLHLYNLKHHTIEPGTPCPRLVMENAKEIDEWVEPYLELLEVLKEFSAFVKKRKHLNPHQLCLATGLSRGQILCAIDLRMTRTEKDKEKLKQTLVKFMEETYKEERREETRLHLEYYEND